MYKPHVGGNCGAVSCNNPYAAEAGLRILKQGGNVFDAACAVSLTLGLVEPYHSAVYFLDAKMLLLFCALG